MSVCKDCFHSYVCEQFNEHRECDNTKCHFFYDHFVPAEDVVEVVRCRDCKYWRDWEMAVVSHGFGPNMGECHCSQWENEYFYYLTEDTDFCSYGERSEEL